MKLLIAKARLAIEVLTVATFTICVCAALANVIVRYLPDVSFSGASDIAMLSFLWSVFLGATLTVITNEHLRVTFIVGLLPRSMATWLVVAAETLVALTLVLLIIGFYIQTRVNVGVMNLEYYDYPINWKYYSGLGFAIVSFVVVVYRVCIAVRRRDPSVIEPRVRE